MNTRLSPHSMRMSGPVLRWQEAVPVGNGLLGALIFGHPRDELLQTNHCRLFEEPERIHAPNMENLVPKLREGLLAGKRREAERDWKEQWYKRTSHGTAILFPSRSTANTPVCIP